MTNHISKSEPVDAAQSMNDSMPDVEFKMIEDGIGEGLILIEQEGLRGGTDSVTIHPVQLRYIAEKSGVVPIGSDQAHQTIATLTRRLHALRKRSAHLADWIAKHSGHKHADFSYEQTYATTTAEIAGEFCADLGGAE